MKIRANYASLSAFHVSILYKTFLIIALIILEKDKIKRQGEHDAKTTDHEIHPQPNGGFHLYPSFTPYLYQTLLLDLLRHCSLRPYGRTTTHETLPLIPPLIQYVSLLILNSLSFLFHIIVRPLQFSYIISSSFALHNI